MDKYLADAPEGETRERFTEHDIRAKVASDDPDNAQKRLQHRSAAMVRTVYDRKPAEVHVLTNRENREKMGGKSE